MFMIHELFLKKDSSRHCLKL